MSAFPTLIFVHGGWHNGSCWNDVMVRLQKAGYPCHAINLPSPQHLSTDTDTIRSTIESYAALGKQIVLISHSLSGLACSNSLKDLDVASRFSLGKAGGVRTLLIIAGFLLPKGFTPGPDSAVPEITSDWWLIDAEKGLMRPDNPCYRFYNDVSTKDAEFWAAQLRPIRVPYGDLTHEGWRDVPVHYLLCEDDITMPYAAQLKMIAMAQDAGADVSTEKLKSSHSPFLSMPGQVVDWVTRVAGKA